MSKIKGIFLAENSKEPVVVEFEKEDTLKSLQYYVEGYIEHATATSYGNNDKRLRNLDIWCNEEGLLQNKQPNIVLNPFEPDISLVVGNIIVTGHRGECTASVPDTKIEGVIEILKELMLKNKYRK